MIRDYCYVRDVVRANLKALSGGDGGVFNIGTTRETKTLQLYRMIYEAVCETRPETSPALASPVKQPARPGDVRRSCLSVKRAGEELGWIPEANLPSGLRLTLR